MRLSIALLVLSCQPTEACAPAAMPMQPPANIVEACTMACKRFEQLGCNEANPSPGGMSCVDLCIHVEEEGVVMASACVINAANCDDVRRCR